MHGLSCELPNTDSLDCAGGYLSPAGGRGSPPLTSPIPTVTGGDAAMLLSSSPQPALRSSWGSTLALAYNHTLANKHGNHLEIVFLRTKGIVFTTAYNKRLTSSDADVQIDAAKRWTMQETLTAELIPNQDTIKPMGR